MTVPIELFYKIVATKEVVIKPSIQLIMWLQHRNNQ